VADGSTPAPREAPHTPCRTGGPARSGAARRPREYFPATPRRPAMRDTHNRKCVAATPGQRTSEEAPKKPMSCTHTSPITRTLDTKTDNSGITCGVSAGSECGRES